MKHFSSMIRGVVPSCSAIHAPVMMNTEQKTIANNQYKWQFQILPLPSQISEDHSKTNSSDDLLTWHDKIMIGRMVRAGINGPLVHSFIQAISIAPLQVHYLSEVLPTQHGYCVWVSRRSATGNSKWRTCPTSLCGAPSEIRTHDPSDKRRRIYQKNWLNMITGMNGWLQVITWIEFNCIGSDARSPSHPTS